MNITDLRTGDRRSKTTTKKDKDESLSPIVKAEQPEDLRSGKDRRHTERDMLESQEESSVDGSSNDESYVRLPINPELQNMLIDMYSDEDEKQ